MPSQCLKSNAWVMLGWLSASAAQAAVYPLPPPDNDVIGQVKVIYATQDDSLLDIARRHGLGYDEMVHANPGLDRWAPGEGTPVVLPTRYILPDTPREGLVLNIAELRLYYYPKAGADGERLVYTYPVSIGRMDWKTPLGITRVTAKEVCFRCPPLILHTCRLLMSLSPLCSIAGRACARARLLRRAITQASSMCATWGWLWGVENGAAALSDGRPALGPALRCLN